MDVVIFCSAEILATAPFIRIVSSGVDIAREMEIENAIRCVFIYQKLKFPVSSRIVLHWDSGQAWIVHRPPPKIIGISFKKQQTCCFNIRFSTTVLFMVSILEVVNALEILVSFPGF